ncbi:conserved hypothetical protein [Gloeothece citriformis PCC 7424]|uniref:Heterocyst frequency control protein PatD n=1 Tax=Gloeothece citriformis (strain PCC 7424) TaxID=65393 RepID=B7KD64_GLOC7|nr:heterocyst frequency control protein PatD [Gloeothece citriformis]ACK73185.1 conserved hypothetical protein [Gloeothece citriformis PCC 7424]
MLPKSYCQAYHSLVKNLLTLQQHLKQEQADVSTIQETYEQGQKIFTEQILTLSPEEIDPTLVSRWQSVQTEIHRSLRLIGTDLLFWRTSKQQTTANTRLNLMSDRLARMIEYCQIMEKGLPSQE